MRWTWSKTSLVAVVAMLGFAGCGGPMEEDFPEEQGAQEQAGDVSALHDQQCQGVKASPKLLWPPNHKFELVTLSGAKNITITSVKQDEPVNDGGDGNTSPDAKKVEGRKDAVYLRAERSGQGDGRVYCISFTAKDCTGTVKVGVPHDQGQGSTPVNSGCKYNSYSN